MSKNIFEMKSISFVALCEYADDMTRLSGHTIVVSIVRQPNGKRKNGHARIRVLPPGYTIDRAIDYGEQKHRLCLANISAYIGRLVGNAPKSYISDSSYNPKVVPIRSGV